MTIFAQSTRVIVVWPFGIFSRRLQHCREKQGQLLGYFSLNLERKSLLLDISKIGFEFFNFFPVLGSADVNEVGE